MKKPFAFGATTVAAAVAISLLNASSVHAQGAPAAESSGGLEEVVVTARYREENLQQTPIAITAITAQDIEVKGFTSASDIALSVPNASFRPAQAAFGNTLTAYIRGVGQSDFNFAFEPGVGIYVDDVYYPTTMSSQFDLMDLERVEVLRGPQGTRFGRGSIGGAVRYVSKQPKGDGTGFITATVGDFHRVDVRAGYDFALVPDKLFARVTAMSKKEDGYVNRVDFACAFPALAGSLRPTTQNRGQNCKVGTLGGTDVSGARAQLRLNATDDLSFDLSFDYQQDNSESRADIITGIPAIPATGGVASWNNLMLATYGIGYDQRFLPPNKFTSYATFDDPYSGLSYPPKTSLEQKGAALTMNWKLTDKMSLTAIGAYRDWNGEFSTDQDGSPLGFSVVNGLQNFTYRTFEARLNGTLLDDRLEWTVGGFVYNGNSRSTQSVQLPAFMGPRFALYANDPTGVTAGLPNSLLVNGQDVGHYENTSGFVHGIYKLTDQLRLSLGGRYSDDKKHDDFDNTVFATPVDSNATRFDWLVGLDYQVTPTMLLYTSASTGYRPPAFNPRPFQRSQFVGVKGENLTAYELGLKSDLFERRLRLNLAGFYSDYKQRIVPAGGVQCLQDANGVPIPGTVPDPDGGAPCLALLPRTNYVNSPGKIKGGELEGVFAPIDNLRIEATAGYTKFTAENALTGGITANGAPVNVPKWNGSAAIQYSFNLANGATLTPRWDAFLQTQICSSVTTLTSCTAGYTLHNVRLEYANADRDWTVSGGLQNVTDKEYLLNIFDLTPFGEPTIEGQPGKPRTWFFSVTRNFK
ncbi:MAG: TonB-dependent receptor [Gammaproteobacteria bacterium]